jgi:hypothetical protein
MTHPWAPARGWVNQALLPPLRIWRKKEKYRRTTIEEQKEMHQIGIFVVIIKTGF